MMNPVKKVVLSCSGGLDTSIVIPWIKENHGGAEVIAYCGDLGQGEDFDALKKKAIAAGASKGIVEDLRETFVREHCFKALQAGAMAEGRPLLGTSLAHSLLAYGQVMRALAEGADSVAHAAAGKGNAQVGFEVACATFAPHLRVLAPPAPPDQTKKEPFTSGGNLWNVVHEGGNLEDPWSAPAPGMFRLSVEPDQAPDRAEELTVGFAFGLPVSIDGKTFSPVVLVEELNRRAAAHGVGRRDVIEDRLVDMKSRGVSETPGGTVLATAHRELEGLCLDRQTLAVKNQIALRYAELICDGLWFSTLRHALAAFVDFTQSDVTGDVRLRLFKGSVTAVGRRSPRSLYRHDLATLGEFLKYDHKDAEGFVRLFSLPERVRAMSRRNQ